MKCIRGFLLLLAILAMVAWLPGNAAAAEHVASGTCGENLTWVLTDDGTLTISGTGDMMECVNPTYVPWRNHTDTIMNVIIQDGVAGIGDWAFYGCSNLMGVTVPDSVTSIGDYAFHSCWSLTGVVIPHGVTSIGSGAFTGCGDLTSIVIPDSVTSIGTGAFNGCSGLTDIEIPASVTSIGSYAFKNCSGLTDIEIPASVTSIGSYAFENCSGLTSVTIPDASIGSGVFQNCSITKLVVTEGSKTVTSMMVMCKGTLEEVTLPDSVTSIGDHAFEGCSGLTDIAIPDSVISIGSSAFEDCSGLTNITIPDNVTSIGDYAFCGCESLKSVTIGSSVASIGSGAFWGCNRMTCFTISDSVTSIGDNAFMACGIKKLTIAEGSKEVTSVMVVCKDALEEVILPGSLTSIGKDAFRGCSGLTGITLPNGMTSIENRAFWECGGLTGITIPDSVTSIGDNAFYECSGLRSVTLGDSLTSIGEDAFIGCSSLTCVVLPDGVTSIGEGAFGGCSSLTSITIPDGVTSIAAWTFSGCTSLTSITLPECVTSIGACAFRACSSLISVTVPDGTASIAVEAFSGCTSLTSITIPGSVKRIEYAAFKDCNSLSDVYYVGSASEWETITVDVDNNKLLSANIHYVHAPVNAHVVRVFGDDRYQTAFKAADTLKAQLGVGKFQNVIVASGTGFADALAGSYLAAVKEAPILLVKGANVNDVKDYIKANLASGGTVYLLGGENAVPKTMETGLDGYNVKRLGGADRYSTNLLILKEAGVGNKDIVVCTGLNFADSLSASAAGLPILLVKDSLTNAQKDFLKTVSGKKIIIGGNSAVNTTIEKHLNSYGEVKRLAGDTRYDTSVLVAKEFFKTPTCAVLAYAQNFPDGLSGGPLAYALKAPLILTDNKKPTAAVNYATDLDISSGYVLGGTGLISDKVANNVFFNPNEEDENEDEKGEVPQDGWFTMSPTSMTLKVGQERSIMASYGGGTSLLTYVSADPAVATVSAYGKVTALSEGTTVITAFYSGLTQTCTVTVIPNETEVPEETEPEIGPAVSIEKSANNGPWDFGYVGNTLSFTVVAKTANGEGRRVIISSSDINVATVLYTNNFGVADVKILFLEEGTATITITSDDGNASTSFTIDVKCYDPLEVATPEDFVNAANYVIGMNGISVSNSGSYTVLTLPWYALEWDEARVQAQNTAHKCWQSGFTSGGCSYQGLNENGEYVFYLYTV